MTKQPTFDNSDLSQGTYVHTDWKPAMDTLREMFGVYTEETLQQTLDDSESLEHAIDTLLHTGPYAQPDSVVQNRSPQHLEEALVEDDELQLVSSLAEQAAEDKSRPLSLHESIIQIVNVFPDVCTDYVKKVYNENIAVQAQHIVEHIITLLLEQGSKYPRAAPNNPRKRKRTDEDSQNKYESRDREDPPEGYRAIARKLLQGAFPYCPVTFINAVLVQNKFLAPTYAAIDKAYQSSNPRFSKLRTARKALFMSEQERMPNVYTELIEELEYAKEKANVLQKNAQLEADAKLAASLEIEEHEENGMMMECQCCYGEAPFSGMTQCSEGHLFCLDCARRNAENEAGRGRYQLLCMAGCKSEFPRREMLRFLDEKLQLALEKNEQEEVLRMADLKDLTKCPFCDYAAICAPIEEDKEFRCGNPDCMEVSCRHCQLKTHIPQTCDEVSKLSVRHKLEEAMTEALVRTCNRCKNKFIKESGCNKMTCSRCRTLQCYVCSQTIEGYDHFNDPSRGGSKNNRCPLFDDTNKRHEGEVEKAAKEAITKLREENPHLTEEDLEIKLSEAVKKRSGRAGGARRPIEYQPVRLNPPGLPPIQHLIPPPPPPPLPPPPILLPPMVPPIPPVLPEAVESQVRNSLAQARIALHNAHGIFREQMVPRQAVAIRGAQFPFPQNPVVVDRIQPQQAASLPGRRRSAVAATPTLGAANSPLDALRNIRIQEHQQNWPVQLGDGRLGPFHMPRGVNNQRPVPTAMQAAVPAAQPFTGQNMQAPQPSTHQRQAR